MGFFVLEDTYSVLSHETILEKAIERNASDAEDKFKDALGSIRNRHTSELIQDHVASHKYFMRMHYFLNATAQLSIASGILVSAAAGYWKNPILSFAASGCGVIGIALRNLSDYSKKEGSRSLMTASYLLEKEGVKGFNLVPDFMPPSQSSPSEIVETT